MVSNMTINRRDFSTMLAASRCGCVGGYAANGSSLLQRRGRDGAQKQKSVGLHCSCPGMTNGSPVAAIISTKLRRPGEQPEDVVRRVQCRCLRLGSQVCGWASPCIAHLPRCRRLRAPDANGPVPSCQRENRFREVSGHSHLWYGNRANDSILGTIAHELRLLAENV